MLTMKKVLALVLALVLVVGCFAACGGNGDKDKTTTPAGTNTDTSDTNKPFDYDAVKDDYTSADGKYEIAFVTDVGQLKDKSFNQGTWEGIKKYASENGKSYKYYQPANGDQATDEDRYNAMKSAAENGAKIIVAAGFLQGNALAKAAEEFTDVKFVFIDGSVLQSSKKEVLKNVAAVVFSEEQSGYLAGYAVVKEGYTKLGFSGGGGGENPACCRFGFGFVQGANDAAKELNTKVDVKYSWNFGSNFQASSDLTTMLEGWYSTGTQVVFACGGSMCQSAFSAAAANDGKVVGVDVDQSNLSDTVITSAMKGIREAVGFSLAKFYDGKFDEIGGVLTSLGAADDAVGLPTDTWSLKKFTVEDYNKLFASIKDGSVKVDNDYTHLEKPETYANVNFELVK